MNAKNYPPPQHLLSLHTLIDALDEVFVNRTIEIEMMATALVAEENVVLVGPAGTGKSMLSKCFAEAINGQFFQCLLGKFTKPDELLGHFSLKEMKDNDEYKRKLKNKLPDAQIGYLDECFKASTALQNSLLTILNEREVDLGNGTRVKANIEMVIGSSNEYPMEKELAALWDRWVFRRHTALCRKFSDIFRIMTDPNLGKCNAKLPMADLQKIRADRDLVDITSITDELRQLHAYCRQRELHVSDRRWAKVAKVIRSRAAMDGRKKATPKDLRILAEVLWNKPEQRDELNGFLANLCSSELQEAMRLFDAAKEIVSKIDWDDVCIPTLQPANKKVKEIITQLAELEAKSSEPEIATYLSEVKDAKRTIETNLQKLILG